MYWANKLFLDTWGHFGWPLFSSVGKINTSINKKMCQITTRLYLANLNCYFSGDGRLREGIFLSND